MIKYIIGIVGLLLGLGLLVAHYLASAIDNLYIDTSDLNEEDF
jgi:hypothetical protein